MMERARRLIRPRLVTALTLAGALVVAGLVARPLVLDELAIRKLASPDESARKEAAEWLARRECVRAIPALLALYKPGWRSSEPDFLATALEALKVPRAAPILREAARSSKAEGRCWALGAMAE